jgi:TATA-binding protein-associated factor
MPSFLGSSTYFVKEFANPIARMQKNDSTASNIATGIKKLKSLHQKVLPFILRREKEQVLQDLPPKNIITIRTTMSSIQAKLYDELCSRTEVRGALDALAAAAKQDSTMNSASVSHEALKSLLLLRLVCTHPSLVITEKKVNANKAMWYDHSVSGKFMVLAQLLQDAGLYRDEIAAADNDSSLLYSGIDAEDVDDDRSGWYADEKIDTRDYHHALSKSKCIIFSQFSKSIDAIENILLKKLMPSLLYLRLDGQVPVQQRNTIVERFNRDDRIKLMLLSTRTGGLGKCTKYMILRSPYTF